MNLSSMTTTTSTTTPEIVVSDIKSRWNFVFNVIVIPCISVNGIFTNLAGYFFLRPLIKQTRVPAYIYLKNMIFVDLAVSLGVFGVSFRHISKYLNASFADSYALSYLTAKVCVFLVNYFMRVSIWTVVLLTVDRYLMMCHTFKYKTWCRVNMVRVAITSIYVWCLLWLAPIPYRYVIVPLNGNDSIQTADSQLLQSADNNVRNSSLSFNASTYSTRNPTKYGYDLKHLSSTFVTYEVAREMLVTYMPLLFLLILKIRIIVAYREMLATKPQSNQSQKGINERGMLKDERTLTLIMFGVLACLIICLTPGSIALILDAVYGKEWRISNNTFNFVSNALETSNYVLNFYVYFLSSDAIRHEFVKGILKIKNKICATNG